MSTENTEPMAKVDADAWKEDYYHPKVFPRIERGCHNWALYVDKCPKCGGKTLHGGGPVTERPFVGYRKAHCCNTHLNLLLPPDWDEKERTQ